MFDLDNTLWRGLIAEDYVPERAPFPIGGWQSGVLEAVKHLKARGIFTAICSKNDEAIVRAYWENAVQPPFATLDDFTICKINWSPKSDNITEIASELNISPVNMLFVDDNPVERAEVMRAHPQIRTIGSNPYVIRRILLWAPETNVAERTAETALREQSVRARRLIQARTETQDREGFLASLGTQMSFMHIADTTALHFARVHELVNKTNQFNTTGERWSFEAAKEFFASGGWIFAYTVRDNFADHGLVGAGFVKGTTLAQLVMSCRVLGMEIELGAIGYLCRKIAAQFGNEQIITGLLKHTDRNGPCRDIFYKAGFICVNENDSCEQPFYFELAAAGRGPDYPPHLRIEAVSL